MHQSPDSRIKGSASGVTAENIIANQPKLFSILESEIAIDAFCRLNESGHSGAPIVDVDGKLKGSLSATDLKGLSTISFLQLLNPVSKCFGHKSALFWVGRNLGLRSIIKRMVEKRLHRIFVCESPDDMTVVGVISIGDVLKFAE